MLVAGNEGLAIFGRSLEEYTGVSTSWKMSFSLSSIFKSTMVDRLVAMLALAWRSSPSSAKRVVVDDATGLRGFGNCKNAANTSSSLSSKQLLNDSNQFNISI